MILPLIIAGISLAVGAIKAVGDYMDSAEKQRDMQAGSVIADYNNRLAQYWKTADYDAFSGVSEADGAQLNMAPVYAASDTLANDKGGYAARQFDDRGYVLGSDGAPVNVDQVLGTASTSDRVMDSLVQGTSASEQVAMSLVNYTATSKVKQNTW